MGDGFEVDPAALRGAGEGVFELIRLMDAGEVEDLDRDSDAVGHDRLAEVLESFCDRWQVGVENLLADGGEMARRLVDTAAQYETTEAGLTHALGGGHG
ncbi:hypothetical protein ACOBQX_05625 [Actinokineospora sp. G85]|uniref:hypothetical protein n=1 Tax=Actinokineospora sp. G85 TaxID=3406626 RepID=UPI003C72880B